MENKRRDKRVVPHMLEPIEVQVMGDGFLDILSAKDIGPSGVGIYVSHGFHGLNIVCEVELIISIPNEKSFKARGAIKHRRQFTFPTDQKEFFGILFTQISEDHRALLERYIEKRLSDKRKDLRVPPDHDKPIEAKIIKEGRKESAKVKDISVGGIGFCDYEMDSDSDQNPEIDFIIALPSEDKLQLKGGLRYNKKPENCIGICFDKLTESQHEAIRSYVLTRVTEIQKKI